jgi:eukaryotic-like serine/threonine-protein kinase
MGQQASSTDAFSGTVLLSAVPEAPRAPDDPLIGCELAAAYRIERVLGEGAMGKVYEAGHVRLDRRFAIKVLHEPLAQREELRARFDREARVMSRIRSDHVVDVMDVTVAPDGRTCIVSELLDGVDLERTLSTRGGRLSAGEAVYLIRQCLRGLDAAHALGVVHRDLKPSNLFLARDASGRITLKVLDFGVAKNGGDAELTAAGTIMGTPAYMAPEQARGARFADARSDLYAAGAVLYRALTGRAPYDETDVNGTLIRLMQEAPERPSSLARDIPPGLEAMIERAMARDPAHRFQTAAEFEQALAPFDGGALLDHEVTSARSKVTAQATTLGRKARLVRPLAIASAVAVSVASAAAVVASLGLLVDTLSKSPLLSATELLLIVVVGLATVAGVGTFAGRALARSYRNAASVEALTRRFGHALLLGAATLGALELLAAAGSTLLESRPAQLQAGFAALRLALALAVGVAMIARPAKRDR